VHRRIQARKIETGSKIVALLTNPEKTSGEMKHLRMISRDAQSQRKRIARKRWTVYFLGQEIRVISPEVLDLSAA
jgi:hypothetical protein